MGMNRYFTITLQFSNRAYLFATFCRGVKSL